MSSSGARTLVTFRSVHDAMAAERILRSRGIFLEMIPVPRAISSECGFCILIDPSSMALGDALGGIEPEAIYRVVETEAAGRARREKRYERQDPHH